MQSWKEGCIEGRKNAWMDERENSGMKGRLHGWMERCMDIRKDLWMNKRVHEWINGCMDGRRAAWRKVLETERWFYEQVDEEMSASI